MYIYVCKHFFLSLRPVPIFLRLRFSLYSSAERSIYIMHRQMRWKCVHRFCVCVIQFMLRQKKKKDDCRSLLCQIAYDVLGDIRDFLLTDRCIFFSILLFSIFFFFISLIYIHYFDEGI